MSFGSLKLQTCAQLAVGQKRVAKKPINLLVKGKNRSLLPELGLVKALFVPAYDYK